MTSIAFTGDITFSKVFENAYEKADLLDPKITEFLRSADHVVANIEAPIMPNESGEWKRLNPPDAVPMILGLNARIWNLANNHINDFKADGIRSTLEYAVQNDVAVFGAGFCKDDAARILELPGSGGVGMFGISYYRTFLKADENTSGCITWEDAETIRANIEKIKKRNRWCVIVAHCGQEFSNIPMPYVRRRYLQWLEMGADVIVAHHPHVVQNYEQVGDKMIFYSLGNFILDTDYQRKQKNTEYGVLVKLNFTETGFTWDYLSTLNDRSCDKIVCSKTPAIFTNIDARQYRLLWPLGVRNFMPNHRITRIHWQAKRAQFNGWQWFRNDVSFFGLRDALELRLGLGLAYLNLWKKADPSLVDYLR